jgi:hypothetical protein
MDTEGILYAFQPSGEDSSGNGAIWNIVWQDNDVGDISAQGVNIAAVCLMPVDDWPPPVFVKFFESIQNTGSLVTWFNTSMSIFTSSRFSLISIKSNI